jgi:hypothetical protein
VALAAVGNAATNVLIPPPFYVSTALVLALLAILVSAYTFICRSGYGLTCRSA